MTTVLGPEPPDRQGTADLEIHQTLHGYDHGHRLLATSQPLPEEDLRVLDRLSDASGPRPDPANDGYLTGYPLPSGKTYALARTWYAERGSRPNVVVTHTLLVPAALLAAPAPSPLVRLLRHPHNTALDKYRKPLHAPDASVPTVVQPDNDVVRLLAELYVSRLDEVWSVLESGKRREELCLAIWDQQWPRLRGAFTFCSGALEPRRLGHRPFDLLLAPASARHVSPHSPPRDTAVARALAEDLAAPGELREYLRGVGGDSARRRVMRLFVGTYLRATMAPQPVPAEVLEYVTRQVPRPTSMRRLKRTVLAPERGLLAHAPATEVLDAVLAPHVAPHVLAADAYLEGWMTTAWLEAPEAVLKTLARPGRGDGPGAPPAADTQAQTVAQLAPDVVSELIVSRATSAQLATVADHDLTLAAALVRRHRGSEDWWSAWAALPDTAFSGLLEHGVPDEVDVARAMPALVAHDDLSRWPSLRERAGAPAVAALVRAIAGRRPASAWADLLREDVGLLRAAMPDLHTADELAVVADVAPDARFVTDTGFATWAPLARRTRLWVDEPHRAAVLFVAADAGHGDEADAALARSYALLYELFATGTTGPAWSLVAEVVPGKHDDWDHCRRLSRRFARRVRGKGQQAPRRLLELLPPGPAREAVVHELDDDQRSDTAQPSMPELLLRFLRGS